MFGRLRSLTILLLSTLSYGAYATEREQLLNIDVQQSLFTEQYKIVMAGERELAVVVREGVTPISRGVAFLIGDAGHSALSPRSLAPLANLLNQYGWVTMNVPAPYFDFSESRKDNSAQSDSQTSATTEAHARASQHEVNEQDLIAHQQALVVHFNAVSQLAEEYQGFRIVIATGTTAASLAAVYAEEQLPLPDAMILVSPFWPDRIKNARIPDLVANTKMPVLDIYTQWDNDWSLSHVEQRNVAAHKALKLHYRQRELIGQIMDNQQFQLLSKEIYGWLSHMGW